jgi:cation diffusion facilitator CzcD-associated flavoprotein CzcO
MSEHSHIEDPRPRECPEKPSAEHHRIAIIGTGFSGLGAAIRLLQSGERDLVLLEKASDVGGCWRDNTYPGIQCDVQSVVYSFSFAPNPSWARAFARGDEIHAYLRGCAERFGVRPLIRLSTEVLDARWSDDEQLWRLETSKGVYTADILVSGHGALSAPAKPRLAGLERFQGPVFHSAEWRHDVPLAGKRVAVIGTGASAIQVVPAIQPEVSRLLVYQRSPAWIVPRPDSPVGAIRRALFRRLPATQRLARLVRFGLLEARILGIVTRPELLRLAEAAARRRLRAQVADRRLRTELTPSYAMGCKRILLSNDFYAALCQPNTSLVASPIGEVTATGIRTQDGAAQDVDVIVLCTGFHVADHPMARRLRGRDGRTLAEYWAEGARAYLGVTVPGFPNLFLLASGPHTGLGHNSMVYVIEAQVEYLRAALDALRRRGASTLELREAAAQTFTVEMQRRLRDTVWSSGCSSFYQDDTGEPVALWPGFAFTYRRRARRFEPEKYVFQGRGAGAAGVLRDGRARVHDRRGL